MPQIPSPFLLFVILPAGVRDSAAPDAESSKRDLSRAEISPAPRHAWANRVLGMSNHVRRFVQFRKRLHTFVGNAHETGQSPCPRS
jgi:hypothetical protein